MNRDAVAKVNVVLYNIKAKYPELRIGQLLTNFHAHLDLRGIDPFYLDDEKYAFHFEEYLSVLNYREKLKKEGK